MPRLSIITINFNNAPGLQKTLESVVQQTSRDFEYIVIDGGSTDGSVELIRQYESHLTYWVSEPDRGIYHAMNKGIQAARGEFCQFLNSGDWLVDRQVVARMLQDMPPCSILIGNLLQVKADGKPRRDRGTAQDITFLTFYRGTLNHSSAYIRRSLFEQYGLYDETLHIAADWKFYLTAVGLQGETVAYRDIDVSFFDTQGISNTRTELLMAERRRILHELLPPLILADYDRYWFDIEQMRRLKRLPLTRWLTWLLERTLFKLEKYRLSAASRW